MVSCWATARNRGIKERQIWVAIAILFLGLGINKQLDLQSALTAGRSRDRLRTGMVRATSVCTIGFHYLRSNSLYQRGHHVADLHRATHHYRPGLPC